MTSSKQREREYDYDLSEWRVEIAEHTTFILRRKVWRVMVYKILKADGIPRTDGGKYHKYKRYKKSEHIARQWAEKKIERKSRTAPAVPKVVGPDPIKYTIRPKDTYKDGVRNGTLS
jgi:hypothetical protein